MFPAGATGRRLCSTASSALTHGYGPTAVPRYHAHTCASPTKYLSPASGMLSWTPGTAAAARVPAAAPTRAVGGMIKHPVDQCQRAGGVCGNEPPERAEAPVRERNAYPRPVTVTAYPHVEPAAVGGGGRIFDVVRLGELEQQVQVRRRQAHRGVEPLDARCQPARAARRLASEELPHAVIHVSSQERQALEPRIRADQIGAQQVVPHLGAQGLPPRDPRRAAFSDLCPADGPQPGGDQLVGLLGDLVAGFPHFRGMLDKEGDDAGRRSRDR